MFTRIVVGAAETEAARKAIDHAIDLARLSGAKLHLVLAFDPYLDRIEPETRPGSAHAMEFLESIAATASDLTPRVHPTARDPAEAILDVARDVDADLIVVGNKGMQGPSRILGSVTNTVSHHAPCSVLIVSTT
ncbi:MAG: universal stress protein [Acidimicrobiales bacterium]